MDTISSAERVVKVGSAHGLHARPAKLFARAAAGTGRVVSLSKEGGTAVNAASILSVIGLRAACGDSITLTVTGEDPEQIADELAAILAADHDE